MKNLKLLILAVLIAIVGGCEKGPQNVSVLGAKLDKTSLELTEGDKVVLTATVLPENATNKSVSWTSSDEKVATVSAAGEVTAVSPGTAAVTVTTEDGGKTSKCEVTVKARVIPVTGIRLNKKISPYDAGL